jgi:hypothetical protein
VFGTTITNSDGREVCVRDLGEEHVIEDLGFIPTVERWLSELPMRPWMGGATRKVARVTKDGTEEAEDGTFKVD